MSLPTNQPISVFNSILLKTTQMIRDLLRREVVLQRNDRRTCAPLWMSNRHHPRMPISKAIYCKPSRARSYGLSAAFISQHASWSATEMPNAVWHHGIGQGVQCLWILAVDVAG